VDISVFDIALVPIIVGLAEIAKKVGFPQKFVPILNLALGLAAGFFYVAPADAREAALVGIALGLSASGLYSGVKNVAQGITK